MTLLLSRMGWDDAWSTTLAEHTATDPATSTGDRHSPLLHIARVARADRGSCELLVPKDDTIDALTAWWAPAIVRAARTEPSAAPATGDWVVLTHAAPDDTPTGSAGARPTLDAVLPRRTAVLRAASGGTSHDQVLAANADIVAIVESVTPTPAPGRIERLLTLAWSSGARPIVVLTKADLVGEPDQMASDIASAAPGVQILTTSAAAGSGLEPLRAWLADGSTIALLGASGVGKSTLLNALLEDDGVMLTCGVRADGKGRHTTVTRELHLAPHGGAVLDTPGMRTLGLARQTALDAAFPDVDDLATHCRFSDCDHRTEPGCAVLTAVATGELPPRRLDNYRKLQREALFHAARTDARLQAEITRRSKDIARERRRIDQRR